jgi:prepilin-type N-terminal cleavage/methylation domain-containing protein
MHQPKVNRGFTLIEMLVSVAVLVLLTALIGQLFSSATITATMSRNHIDSDEAARQVLDRMGSDLGGMPRSSNIKYIFYKNNGAGATGSSDAMFFYSQAPGYIDSTVLSTGSSTAGVASPMALVGYRINQNAQFNAGAPVLERLGETLTWGGVTDTSGTSSPGGMAYLPNPVTSLFTMKGSWTPTLAGNWAYTVGTPPYDGPTQEGTGGSANYDTSHYQVLSGNVFRMEFCFLLKSGTYSIPGGTVITGSTGYSNTPTAIPAMTNTSLVSGSQGFITSSYFGGPSSIGSPADLPGNVYGFPPDLYGIVVTIAVLDDGSRKIIPAGGLSRLAGALNDSLPLSPPSGFSPQPGVTTPGYVQANPEPTAQIWQSELEQQGFAEELGIPQAALQRVRVYERTFYLDEN